MINLNEMAVFERVVRAGSFTGAARAMGVSKSSVSAQIARLESRLGARLLHRTTRRLGLTDVGAAYHQRCSRIVAEAQEADQAAGDARLAPHGTLRLTAPYLFGNAFLSPVVADYLRRYPEVGVDLMLAERLVDLIEEGLDLAIRIGPLEDSTLTARGLGAAQMIYCASPAYLGARGAPKAPDELGDHECIIVGNAASAKWPFASPRGPLFAAVKGRLTINSLIMGRDAALAGHGIAYLPGFLCADQLSEGSLLPVLGDWLPAPYPISAIYPSQRHLSAKVRCFLDLLIERTTPSPPWSGARPGRQAAPGNNL